MAKKKTQGRKKIEMKMIADENARRITFSKRRNGLFKKATELSTLCGVEIAIIVFSIGGKPFTFGHPNVDSILDRFINEDKQVDKHSISHAMRYQEAKCHELKQRFEEMHQEVEEKRKQKKALEKNILAKSSYKSFEEYIQGLDLCELQQLKEKMENLKEKVALHGKRLQPSNSLKHVEEANLENIEKHTLDGSPIPVGWLRL